MINVTVRTEIKAAADEAFAYVADHANNTTWQSGIQSTTWTSDPPIRVGSTYNQTADFKNTVTAYEVTALDPGHSIRTESRHGATFPVTVTRTVVPLGEARCRITVDLVGRPRGLRRLLQPLVANMVRKSIEADYLRLKRLLETNDEPSEP